MLKLLLPIYRFTMLCAIIGIFMYNLFLKYKSLFMWKFRFQEPRRGLGTYIVFVNYFVLNNDMHSKQKLIFELNLTDLYASVAKHLQCLSKINFSVSFYFSFSAPCSTCQEWQYSSDQHLWEIQLDKQPINELYGRWLNVQSKCHHLCSQVYRK